MEHVKEKSSKLSAALVLTGTAALTIAGAIIIPPLLRKYGNKLYKSSIKNEEIDFDNLGPEIVRKEEQGVEE